MFCPSITLRSLFNSRHPGFLTPARVEGEVRAAVLDTTSAAKNANSLGHKTLLFEILDHKTFLFQSSNELGRELIPSLGHKTLLFEILGHKTFRPSVAWQRTFRGLGQKCEFPGSQTPPPAPPTPSPPPSHTTQGPMRGYRAVTAHRGPEPNAFPTQIWCAGAFTAIAQHIFVRDTLGSGPRCAVTAR